MWCDRERSGLGGGGDGSAINGQWMHPCVRCSQDLLFCLFGPVRKSMAQCGSRVILVLLEGDVVCPGYSRFSNAFRVQSVFLFIFGT